MAKEAMIIRITPEIKEKIKKEAQVRGVSANALISQVLYLFCKEEAEKCK